MKGSPAEEAGSSGDVILVDGKAISTSDEAASLIRGPAGTDVTITLGRGTESFDVTITRREISVPATSYEMLETDIGYIELMSFNEHSDTEVAAALQSLKSDGAKAIVLDLRYNGGGYVNQCLNIAEMLIPEGPVVTLDYKNQPQETYSSRGSGLGLPLFVLVNRRQRERIGNFGWGDTRPRGRKKRLVRQRLEKGWCRGHTRFATVLWSRSPRLSI